MILDKNNDQQHDLYVKAIKSLNEHNKVSEYRKSPETREERAFMQETNKACSTSCFGMNIPDERWYIIFGRIELNEMD